MTDTKLDLPRGTADLLTVEGLTVAEQRAVAMMLRIRQVSYATLARAGRRPLDTHAEHRHRRTTAVSPVLDMG